MLFILQHICTIKKVQKLVIETDSRSTVGLYGRAILRVGNCCLSQETNFHLNIPKRLVTSYSDLGTAAPLS